MNTLEKAAHKAVTDAVKDKPIGANCVARVKIGDVGLLIKLVKQPHDEVIKGLSVGVVNNTPETIVFQFADQLKHLLEQLPAEK